jgi:H+-transporting ATPase
LPNLQASAVDGFAGVYPEHKFKIVEALQSRGMLVGMTGAACEPGPPWCSGACDAIHGCEHARPISPRLQATA